jgi:photosystem II stability/assembly factor-like uncharacterized protein
MKARVKTTASVRRRRTGIGGALLVAALAVTTLASSVSASASPSSSPPSSSPPSSSPDRQPASMVRQVSARMPIQGPSRALAALRPQAGVPRGSDLTPAGEPVNTWKPLFTMPGAVVHDVDFPTAKIGYAAAELGQLWKTTDGGKSWTKILNRGFPYYYYGVEALNRKTLVISGFNNQTSEGIISWSDDGGATWSADQVLSPNAWIGRIRIPGTIEDALAMNGGGASGTDPNVAWYTTQPNVWHQVVPDPNGGWFGNQFTLLRDEHAYASGITYCESSDIGADWTCRPSIDEVFDGPTAFLDQTHGWVGGGEISPEVAGWLHRTTDGGSTWSGRVLETPWPVRQIQFLSPKVGWATGGNVFSGVGGIYFTSDGGKTWAQDIDTGDEVGACASHPTGSGNRTLVWCIGAAFNGSQFTSTAYRTTVPTP